MEYSEEYVKELENKLWEMIDLKNQALRKENNMSWITNVERDPIK